MTGWRGVHGKVKVFTNRYICKELELSVVDLLRKVQRIAPPEKRAPVLSEEELARALACYDRGTFEDVRDRAFVAIHACTGLRLSEVLALPLASFDRISGDIQFVGAKGNGVRQARVSPRAMRHVREYLRLRPSQSVSGCLFVQEDGRPLGYWGRLP